MSQKDKLGGKKDGRSPLSYARAVVLGAMELAPQMTTIVRCNNCGAEYHRTPEKFLMPHTGHASCTICGDTLEYWVDDTHLAIFELVTRSDGSPRNVSQTR